MSAPIERHGQEVWRKTAEQLNGDGFSVGGDDSPGKDVNKNGAPLLGDSRDLFRPKTSDIPAQPGVYKWRDGEGRVIYVGKAKNLRNRLTNYFQPLYQLHPRTQTMVLTARNLEWTVVGTELESLTLEYTWIKEFDPRFNVVFRDDKTYPYLAISSGERVPRVWVTRSRKRRDTKYGICVTVSTVSSRLFLCAPVRRTFIIRRKSLIVHACLRPSANVRPLALDVSASRNTGRCANSLLAY